MSERPGSQPLTGQLPAPVAPRLPRIGRRGLLTLLLAGAFLWSILQVDWRGELLHRGGADVLAQILREMARPELSASTLRQALAAAWLTLTYAVAGITVALALAVPLGIAASGALVRHPVLRPLSMASCRVVLGFARAIHELVWALLFVAAIGLSPFAAVFALAIPYAGVLGRIYADLLNDVPEAPLDALRAAGARETKVLLYGRLPMAVPDMVSYTFYRFECALRSSAIMSFVGIGGLGYQIQIALDDLLFSRVATHLLALIILVAVVDIWSSEVRRRLVR